MRERMRIDRHIQHGKPVIKGTRVPSGRVLGGLSGGMSVEAICREYGVTPDEVHAALQYATELITLEEVHPLPAS